MKKPQALAHCGSPGSKLNVYKMYPAPVRKAKSTPGVDVNKNERFRCRNKSFVAARPQRFSVDRDGLCHLGHGKVGCTYSIQTTRAVMHGAHLTPVALDGGSLIAAGLWLCPAFPWMASQRPGLPGSLIGGIIEPADAQGTGVAGWDILASEAPFRA
jgi:hypothetical protein